MIDQKENHKRYLNDESKDCIKKLSELRDNFSSLPDKQKAWENLTKLTTDTNSHIKSRAVHALGIVFPYMPDKEQAWNDIHQLTSTNEDSVKYRAFYVICSIFSQVPDKQQAWNDLIKLTNGEYSSAASYYIPDLPYTVGYIFSQVPDKQQAWNDLILMATDRHWEMRSSIISTLYSVFSQVPDKQQVWDDLIKLTSDQDHILRIRILYVLDSTFNYLTDKEQISRELVKLINSEDGDVRAYANHSLGKLSIFRASQAETEENYRNELENAISFFEKASKESMYINSSQFCLPFYRSFHSIVFEKQRSREEIERYLSEAKKAVKGSKSKELLYEAVNNLSNALSEIQKLEGMDLVAMKGELNFYREYCDRATELIKDTNEKAPVVTATLRRGLPILDRKLKGLIEEIQDKAKIACKESLGTATEVVARAVSREVQKWRIASQEEMTQRIEALIETFRLKMPHLPGYEHIFKEIEGIRDETDLIKQYKIIDRLIGLIPMFSSMPDRVVQDIRDIKDMITPVSDELRELRESVDKLTSSIDELQNPQEYLDIIQGGLEVIKDYMPGMKEQIEKVLSQLNSSSSSTTQKLEIALPIIPQIVTYKVEVDVPKHINDIKNKLRNLVLKFKNK